MSSNIQSSVLDYGAKGDGVRLLDGAMQEDSAVLTSQSGSFLPDDVGKKITVRKAGPSGGLLVSEIASWISTKQVTLSDDATVTVTGATVVYGTDDTVSIQAALNENLNVVLPGTRSGRRYMFTHLTVPARSSLAGDGAYCSILRQFEDVAVGIPALTLTGNLAPNIADGARYWSDFGVEVQSNVGVSVKAASASLSRTRNLRLMHLVNETASAKPYPVVGGTIGFDFDARVAPQGAIFLLDHRTLEIRSFETAMKAVGAVNDNRVHGWFLDCKYGFDLEATSCWHTDVAFETGVDDAIKYRFRSSVSNFEGCGRCEIAVATDPITDLPVSSTDQHMVEFIGTVLTSMTDFRDKPILISQDGNAWPGRKYKGTLPRGALFHVQVLTGGALTHATFGNDAYTLQQGPPLQLGGLARGNGSLLFGRAADNVLSSIEVQDGLNLTLDSPNGVKIAQLQFGNGYLKPFIIGSYMFWVDSLGKLRIKPGYPTSDTDGDVVGSQS